jgi:hypothetical protein
MNQTPPFIISIITLLTITLFCCTNDKTPLIDVSSQCADIEATYDFNIKPIIDNSCALGGCHVTGGDGPGVYVNYNNLIPFIEDGSFKRTVIDQKDDPIIGMPPDYATNGAPLDLTEEELELVKCWVDRGYPEN